MSEVAGKIATQAGAFMLEKPLGGRGLLLGGVPGVAAGKVMVIGGGVVGQNAAEIAIGMGRQGLRLRPRDRPPARARGAAQRPLLDLLRLDAGDRAAPAGGRPRDRRGARARREGAARRHARAARPDEAGAVLVDVAIDQGGCFETSRATTHSNPTYVVDGITHYCVANMPGAVPVTSTYALTNATMPCVVELATGEPAPRSQATRPSPASTSAAARSPTAPSPRRRARSTQTLRGHIGHRLT